MTVRQQRLRTHSVERQNPLKKKDKAIPEIVMITTVKAMEYTISNLDFRTTESKPYTLINTNASKDIKGIIVT